MKNTIDELIRLKYDVSVDLYRQKAKILDAKSRGLECFVYKAFGYQLIGSLALLLDPRWQITKRDQSVGQQKLLSTVQPVVPVPVNRTRTFTTQPAFQPFYKDVQIKTTCANAWTFVGHWVETPYSCSSTTTPRNGNLGSPQTRLQGSIKDTTWKSRNPGKKITRRGDKTGLQSQGEYELFIPTLKSVGPSYGYCDSDQFGQIDRGGGLAFNYNGFRSHVTGSWSSPCVSVASGSVTAYQAAEAAYATSVMVKNLDSMMARCVPSRRYFNLGYQIGELKDLPQTLRGTLQLWRDVERIIGPGFFVQATQDRLWWTKERVRQLSFSLKKVNVDVSLDLTLANCYLNFKFGWESMVQAVVQLVKKPQLVTKEVNFLIARNGKFTNLSTTKSWSEPVASFPTLNVPVATASWDLDSANPPSYSAMRKVELRCMCNVGINFPRLSVPALRSSLFAQKIGLYPTPGDLYDLIPWTWMIDWFVGLGDYIHVMDAINGTDNLINYGFMSYKSLTTVTAHWSLKKTCEIYRILSPGGTSDTFFTTYLKPTSSLEMKYELRKSLSTLENVKTYSGTGLSGYQSSILGALLSKFI